MKKSFVKLIPDKNVKDVTLSSIISFEDNRLILSLKNPAFNVGEIFDVIIEEGIRLKFMRVSLESSNGNESIFEVSNIRFAIKREYERISLILNVNGLNFPAQTVNISAGGMQLKSQKEPEINKILNLEIDYLLKKISVKYQVLRIDKDKNKILISGKFIDLDKDSKAFIIQQNLKNKIFSLRSSSKKTLGGKNE